jgi:hypothetical protein
MDEKIIEIEKNSREIIRISLSEFKGKKLIDLRVWYKDKEDEYKPSQKGLSLSVDKYKELKDAIEDLGEMIGSEKE